MAIWRDLEAEGIRRCCAIYKDGKRCRRRVAKPFDSWCAKHGPIIKAHTDFAMQAIKEQQRQDDEVEQ